MTEDALVQNLENPIDIYVIGTGMVGYRQLTKEAEAAIEESGRVYLLNLHGVVEEYLEQFDVETYDLRTYYEEHRDRREIYDSMAEHVLDAADDTDSPITFAAYGHPLVFVSPSQLIIDRAPERGLTVETRPGISSMDCLFVDLQLDPGVNGIQMYEATDLLTREFRLNPDVPAMIWQIGALETGLYDTAPSKPERFSRIREYLQQFYPSDHTMTLARSATYPITESKLVDFKLDAFESMADQITGLHTLYIPPVRTRPVQNEELAAQLGSKAHLDSVTERDGEDLKQETGG